MKNLTKKEQKEYDEIVKRLSSKGIEIGKVIELWQAPERIHVDGNDFIPKNLKNSDKKNDVCFYKDQYGIIQSAILVQKYFATVTKMEPDDYYGLYVAIYAEDTHFTFIRTTNCEWSRMRKDGQGYSHEFMLAEDSYNGNVLFLDKDGNRPEPQKPIVICKDHDWAHNENVPCVICNGHDNRSKELLRPCNTGHVLWKNDDVYMVPVKK